MQDKRVVTIFTFIICLIVLGGLLVAQTKDPLAQYKRRRNFARSPEPPDKKGRSSRMPMFVIQKHAARSMHYDFRLSIGGVLVSWAVPKGPSMSTRLRRLAIRTDDHPIAYAQFEGVIPKGEYGAGTVMVWDKGTYRNIKKKGGKKVSMAQCLVSGQIEVWLEGDVLRGAYVLLRRGKEKQWLLIKMKDEHASERRNPVNTHNKSVLTGRTMRQITADEKKKAEKKVKK